MPSSGTIHVNIRGMWLKGPHLEGFPHFLAVVEFFLVLSLFPVMVLMTWKLENIVTSTRLQRVTNLQWRLATGLTGSLAIMKNVHCKQLMILQIGVFLFLKVC